jgi:hypothetical protein
MHRDAGNYPCAASSLRLRTSARRKQLYRKVTGNELTLNRLIASINIQEAEGSKFRRLSLRGKHFVIMDRDSLLHGPFRDLFQQAGIRPMRAPTSSPNFKCSPGAFPRLHSRGTEPPRSQRADYRFA